MSSRTASAKSPKSSQDVWVAYPTQLSAPEQDTLVKQIGLALLRAAPRDWKRIVVHYRTVGRYHELDGEITLADGSVTEWVATHDIATLFARLRSGMYREQRGTWFNAHYTLEAPASYNLEYDREEPEWKLLPPPQAYADELRMFPRSEENVPEWLMRRLAGLGPERPGPRLHIARVFDGTDSSGRPVIDRDELDPEEQADVLAYLEDAPVVRPGRGFDVDQLAENPEPAVPVGFHSDGEWIWPAAVPYYLRKYGVTPEPALLAHIRDNGYRVPEVSEEQRAAAADYLARGNAAPEQPAALGGPPMPRPGEGPGRLAGPPPAGAPGASGTADVPGASPGPRFGDAGGQGRFGRPGGFGQPGASAGRGGPMPPIPGGAGQPAAPGAAPQARDQAGVGAGLNGVGGLGAPGEPGTAGPGRPGQSSGPGGRPDAWSAGAERHRPDADEPDGQETTDEFSSFQPVDEDPAVPSGAVGGQPSASREGEPGRTDEPPAGSPGPGAVAGAAGAGLGAAGFAARSPFGREDDRDAGGTHREPGNEPEAPEEVTQLWTPDFARSQPGAQDAPSDERAERPGEDEDAHRQAQARVSTQYFTPGFADDEADDDSEAPAESAEDAHRRAQEHISTQYFSPVLDDDPDADDLADADIPVTFQPHEGPEAEDTADDGDEHEPMGMAEGPPGPGDERADGGFGGGTETAARDLGAPERPHEDFRTADRPHEDFRAADRPHEDFRAADRPRGDFGSEQADAFGGAEGFAEGARPGLGARPELGADHSPSPEPMAGQHGFAPEHQRTRDDAAATGTPTDPAKGFAGAESRGQAPGLPGPGGFAPPEFARQDPEPIGAPPRRQPEAAARAEAPFGEPAFARLQRKLEELGVPGAAYRIGEPIKVGWSLEQVPEGWRVGRYDDSLSDSSVFGDAADAAAFMLGKILLEPNGRAAAEQGDEGGRSGDRGEPPAEPGRAPAGSLPTARPDVSPAAEPRPVPPPAAGPVPPPSIATSAAGSAGAAAEPRDSGAPRPRPNVPSPGMPSAPGNWPIQPLPGEPPLTLFRGKKLADLPVGSELDRFGDPDGNLTYVAGTPFPERSLVPEWVNRPYHVYRVQQPIEALTGVAIPWFNQPGGGTAYVLPASIEELLAEGVLIELEPGEPPVA